MQLEFAFLEHIKDPATSGVGEVIDNTRDFYRDHYCRVYPTSCFEVETLDMHDAIWNSSYVYEENYLIIFFEMRVSFNGNGAPSAQAARQTALEFDTGIYLRNFVNTVSEEMSPNFKL
jgi:hypothetical protein